MGILAPETADQIFSATSQQFCGLYKDSGGDSPIRILNLWACECDLLAQEVILAHSATPRCCFDNFVSMAPNSVRQERVLAARRSRKGAFLLAAKR